MALSDAGPNRARFRRGDQLELNRVAGRGDCRHDLALEPTLGSGRPFANARQRLQPALQEADRSLVSGQGVHPGSRA